MRMTSIPSRHATHIAALAERNGWRPEVIGYSVQQVPIVAWFPQAAPTRVVWAAMHGEEAVTLQAAHQLLRTIDARDACAVVVPVLNPDGVLLGTRQNVHGVDLNRNFPTASWQPDLSPTYFPTATTRRREFRTQLSSPGEAPGSEPETRALMALIERVEPAITIDLHTPLECIIAPTDAAVELAEHLAEPASLRIKRALNEPTPGDGATWCSERGAIAVTYECELAPFHLLWKRHVDGLTRCVVERRFPLGAAPRTPDARE